MSLDVSKLESDIKQVIKKSKTDTDFAKGLAESIFLFIEDGEISGSIAGTCLAPPGVFSGSVDQGSSMSINKLELEADINDIFERMGSKEAKEQGSGDTMLAEGLAAAIDVACRGTIDKSRQGASWDISISGDVVMTSPPWSSSASDSGIGSWDADVETLAANFSDIFREMGSDEMKKKGGGDDYMAEQIANAINIYMVGNINPYVREATITVVGASVLAGSVGSCSIS